MVPYDPRMRHYIHLLLRRWYMKQDLAQVRAMAETAGVEIVGVRRLYLGDTRSTNFGKVEEMTLAEWQRRQQ